MMSHAKALAQWIVATACVFSIDLAEGLAEEAVLPGEAHVLAIKARGSK
jgi:hypothetical protein